MNNKPIKQEPYAWAYETDPSYDGKKWNKEFELTFDYKVAKWYAGNTTPIPLYTHPKELSDEEMILAIKEEFKKPYDQVIELCATLKNDLKISMLRNLTRAILRKAQEK